MVRITAVGLSLLVFAFAAMVQPRPSEASCRCRCVEGQMLKICSKWREAGDAQVRCPKTACPATDVRPDPSKSNRRCRRRRVTNPHTGHTRWEKLCMKPGQAGPAQKKCKKVDFINRDGLYDTKTVCR
jgi:hypothetical protein